MTDSAEPKLGQEEMFGHQPDVVQIGTVIRVGIGLAVMVVVAMIGMVMFFRGLDVPEAAELPEYATRSSDVLPAPPRLDPAQSLQLRQLREEHERILSTYEWVDKEQGLARIPIDRAMERLVQQQLPARNNSESD